MTPVKHSILLTISTPSVAEIATEGVERKKALLKNGKGEFVELKPHQLKKDLIKFLESSGISIEYMDTISRRGKVNMAGVQVKVSPLNHTNYDSGALIKVQEENGTSEANTLKVLKLLTKHGIDLDKYCLANDNGKSCLTKLKGQM